MSRRRTLTVLVVVAALACWGAATAAVAAPAPAAAGATGPTATADVQQQQANATVAFDDQNASDTTITVSNVSVPEGGYVAIHDSSLLDGAVLDSVVGVSDYLEPGTYENVTVTLYEGVPGADFTNRSAPNGTATYIAMPHLETDANVSAENASYDFVATNGSEDGPYVTDGAPVTDDAEITFGDAAPSEPPTDQPEPPAATGFEVDSLSAPESVEPGDSVTVAATITNTGDERRTETIAFRLAGNGADIVVPREVSLDPGVTSTVSFDVSTEGLAAGEYIHGITTESSSSFAILTVTNVGPPDDFPPENETDGEGPAPPAEGEAPGNDTDDNATDGAPPNGNVTDGNVTDGNMTDGNVTNGNVTDGNMTDGNMTDGNVTEEVTTTVTFTDQTSGGTTVTVESVTLADGGFVVIHDNTFSSVTDRGSIIGVSDYLEAGTHENVTVTLYGSVPGASYDQSSLSGTTDLTAVAHIGDTFDTDFEFITTGTAADGPYFVDGSPVRATATVTVGNGTA